MSAFNIENKLWISGDHESVSCCIEKNECLVFDHL